MMHAKNATQYARTEAVVLCRAAADKLSSAENRDEKILFLGWDFARMPAAEKEGDEAIRRAAAAILGDEDPDSGTKVTMGDLAALVRYIADMIEE
ncbi:MAG: hypothetical protein ACLQNE_04310 [Thermoguttaceae bacterium]